MNNFVKRTITAVIFAAVMVGGLILNPLAFGALFLVVMVFAMDEFFRMSVGGRFLFQQKMALLTSAIVFTVILCSKEYDANLRWLSLALVPFFAILVSCFFQKSHEDFGQLAFVFAAILCIALPVCTSPFLVFDITGRFNGFILLAVFIVIWCCDIGAYLIGTALGQRPGARKLAPSISPKKSWAGFWGGIVMSVAGAFCMHLTGWFPFPLIHCLALGLVIGVGSVCGDLFESMWKRFFDVKDSGNCIPGHGGMYDRFDSSLFAMPLTVLYLTIFNLL